MSLTVRFALDRGSVETAERTLHELGAQAISYLDAGDVTLLEPAPGQTPWWPRMVIEALFPDHTPIDRILLGLLVSGLVQTANDVEFGALDARDWTSAWMDRFAPMRFGRSLWVCPSNHPVDPAWPVVVRLDPGLAFGTGTHPTTALCLEWLDAAALTDRLVVDYGCGSGVLAIAAARLGAGQVLAVDYDPQALVATAENARRNAVADRIETCLPGQLPDSLSADVLVANILSGPLIELATRLVALLSPGGRLVLAGILADQTDQVLAAYAGRLTAIEVAERAGWVRLSGRTRSKSRPRDQRVGKGSG